MVIKSHALNSWDGGGFNTAIHGLFQDTIMEENVQRVKEQLMTRHDISKEGRIPMKEVVPRLHLVLLHSWAAISF